MRQAQGGRLPDIGDVGAPLGSVLDRSSDLILGVTHDDSDVSHPSRDDPLQGVKENRLIGYRHQLFRVGVGDRPQPRPPPSAEHECLHGA